MMMKNKIVIKMILIISLFLFTSCGGNNKKVSKVVESNKNTVTDSVFYKLTDQKLFFDIALYRHIIQQHEFPLVNFLEVLPYFIIDTRSVENLNIYLSQNKLYLTEFYENSMLKKRYVSYSDNRYYKYTFFEYDRYQRMTGFYNKDNDGDLKVANERSYEYYVDDENRLYQFEITDNLGATQINKTSQVFVQSKTETGYKIEEIHSITADMRELTYDELPEKLSRTIYLITVKNGRILNITKKEKVHNTVLEIDFSYSGDLITKINYTKYYNQKKDLEEIIEYEYNEDVIIKEKHIQKKYEDNCKEYEYGFIYSDFDDYGHFENQIFYGSTYEFDLAGVSPVIESDGSKYKWEWN